MTITYQAGDALLYTTRNALVGDVWADHVYIDEAKSTVSTLSDVWVVVTLLDDRAGGVRGDRDERALLMRCSCVGERKDQVWAAAAKVYALLHNGGVQDTRQPNTSIGVHSEWDFLTVTAGRMIHLTPSKDIGVQFYEAGYEFSVKMEAKNGYS